MKHILICLTLFSTQIFAQKEGNWWYFGNTSSIDFSTNPPTAYTGSGMFTYDNASVVSDQNGQLLFYTNGVTVWNRLHLVMSNGTGLLGNNSGGQSALIVPQPNSNLYYVFTVPNHGLGALRYSIVDMSLSGGNGAVTTKNVILHNPTTEKLDSYYDCANNKYWVVSHQYGTNSFYTYQVSSTGISPSPVISSVGNVHNGGSPSSSHDAMGQLTISPNGSLIATGQQFSGAIQIFDFNILNGNISNPRTISYPSPWGISFSRNSNMLYVSQWLTPNVVQFNISNPNIPGSPLNIGVVTGTTGGYGAGYMQLAPNDKIYIAKWASSYLSMIESPNLLGSACNFIDDGIDLGGVLSQAGVCRTVSRNLAPLSINVNINCDSASFSLNDTSGISNILWDFGGGNQSSSFFPREQFTQGTHPITVYVTRCNYTDTLSTSVVITSTNSTISSQINCQQTIALQILPSGLSSCFWNLGDGTSQQGFSISHQYTLAGTYQISAITTDVNGCIDSITNNVIIPNSPVAIFSTQINPCTNSVNFINSSIYSNNYIWSFGDGTINTNPSPSHVYASNGSYNVQLIASDGNCFDTINQFVILDTNILFYPTIDLDTCAKKINCSWNGVTPDSCFWVYNSNTFSTLLNPSFAFNSNGQNIIHVISNPGSNCSDTNQLIFDLTNIYETPINYSNTFSPNGDGVNDVLFLRDFHNCEAVEFTIYNRWGKEMFSSKNSNDFWDGKKATEGTYFLIVKGGTTTKNYTITLFR